MRAVSSLVAALSLCAGASVSAQSPQSGFDAAVAEYGACMTATVRMGMTTKMDPAVFRAGLDKSCKPQEAKFRAAAMTQAMALGRTHAQAAAEIEGNIARGKAIWAADQESYVRTGRVPR